VIPVANDHPIRRLPVVTRAIILANAGIFVYQLVLGPERGTQFLFRWALVPNQLAIWRHGWDWHLLGRTLLRCFTSMFLHGGWLHIIGNMWTLWIFGQEIEDRLGHLRFLLFHLLAGLLAAALHLLLNFGSPIPTVGASGAIAGVMGAYFLLFPFNWITFIVPVLFIPIPIKLPAAVYLLFWIIMQFAGAYATLGDTASTGIAFWAHVGGFLGGMYLIRRWGVKAPKRPRRATK
jgi:membrane associated rhomboid family serine protease